ncbi:MAG: hypothetical protein Q7S27_06385 [Nanoarchaeota archaeon]|nr:hypothetical protein [Nanoarchaeota archaeon]
MMDYPANFSKKAQIKIQQMAFVLVALVIFLAIVSLFYFSISLNNLKKDASSLQDLEAEELVRKLASTPEFSLTSKDCAYCIDLDKVFLLKQRKAYQEFWNLDFLQIEKISSSNKMECQSNNYPQCNTITLIENDKIGSPSSAFVSLCYWSKEKGGYTKCEVGRVYASGKGLK